MPEKASLLITVYGLVQGVFFRRFVQQHAVTLGLRGYVRNVPQGGAVEVRTEGEREQLEKLLEYIKVGPRGSRVDRVEIEWSEYKGDFSKFEVRY